MRWKGTLPEGSVYRLPVISLDIFVTALAAAGGELPTDRVYDGVNLVPFLRGKDKGTPHEALYWRYGESLAMRQGPRGSCTRPEKYPAQLYDLDSDVGETLDLSQKEPARCRSWKRPWPDGTHSSASHLWGTAPPNERSSDWLYDVLQDPHLLPKAGAPGAAAAGAAGAARTAPVAAYWPRGADWETLPPAAAGMNEGRLQAAVQYALEQNSLGVLVLRQGKIVSEGYAENWGRDKARSIASATKSMTAILVGMALDDGKFRGLDQPIADFARLEGDRQGSDPPAALAQHDQWARRPRFRSGPRER